MSKLAIYVCEVRTDNGMTHYVTLLPPEESFEWGLAAEAIVGSLLDSWRPDEPITPAVFARNRVFVDFLHGVIAREAPKQANFRAEAGRLGNGWVYIIDQRTAAPDGTVPPEDIFGGVEVRDGQAVPDSYRPNPNHRILSDRGFFQLEEDLKACLLRELAARPSAPADAPPEP